MITTCIPKLLVQKIFYFLINIRKDEKSINFNDKKIRNNIFYKNRKIRSINDTDANNILISKKEQYGTKKLFKYFIEYNDNDNIRPLCIKLLQMTGYAKKIDDNVTMSFTVKEKSLFKKYIKIW